MKWLKEGKHSNKAFQEGYDKYGADRKALYQAKKEYEEGLV